MTTDIQKEVAAAIDQLAADIQAAPSRVVNKTLLGETVLEIGGLMLDPNIRNAAPVSQLWRLLTGLHIAGAITDDERYRLTGRFRDLDMRLYPVEEE